jgi:hypothetical protein
MSFRISNTNLVIDMHLRWLVGVHALMVAMRLMA